MSRLFQQFSLSRLLGCFEERSSEQESLRLSGQRSSPLGYLRGSPFLSSSSVISVLSLSLQPPSSRSWRSSSGLAELQKSILSLRSIWQKVWYFFSIFWWWLRHCSASRVEMKLAMFLKILSVLLRYLRMKCLLWISRNQWYFLFSQGVQCPFWMFFSSFSAAQSFTLVLRRSDYSLCFFLASRMWLFLRNSDWKLQPGITFSSCGQIALGTIGMLAPSFALPTAASALGGCGAMAEAAWSGCGGVSWAVWSRCGSLCISEQCSLMLCIEQRSNKAIKYAAQYKISNKPNAAIQNFFRETTGMKGEVRERGLEWK